MLQKALINLLGLFATYALQLPLCGHDYPNTDPAQSPQKVVLIIILISLK